MRSLRTSWNWRTEATNFWYELYYWDLNIAIKKCTYIITQYWTITTAEVKFSLRSPWFDTQWYFLCYDYILIRHGLLSISAQINRVPNKNFPKWIPKSSNCEALIELYQKWHNGTNFFHLWIRRWKVRIVVKKRFSVEKLDFIIYNCHIGSYLNESNFPKFRYNF